MKSFNEWREKRRFDLREGEIVLQELTGQAPQPQIAGSGGTPGIADGVAPRTTPGAPSDAIDQTDIWPFMRLMKRITGQDLADPQLIQALKQLARKAPEETGALLQGILSMTPGQLKRMQKGYDQLTAPPSNTYAPSSNVPNTPQAGNSQPQVKR